MKDDEEKQISRLLGGLTAVEAPEGFEGEVRTRIAQRNRSGSLLRPSVLLAAKFALPLLVLVFLGGFLIFSGESTIRTDMVAPVEDDAGPAVAVLDASPDAPIASNTEKIENVPNPRPGVDRDQPAPPVANGTSVDMGLSHDDTTIFPEGVDPRKTKITNVKPPTGGKISPSSVLSMLGISAVCSRTGCSAAEVREGTLAYNAGIREGDQIVAIDGTKLNSSTSITGRFTVTELTVIREGQQRTIPMGRP